ncbi:MAG TPA: Ig-like domain-containing protein, partial [Thermoplasmata archaeon]|nr:Ig-like domain-containing protein [Thermoplasmata archaeon]
TLDPSNQRLFVGEESTGKVTVINASSLQIVTNISTGGSPGVPAFDPSNGLVYVPDASPTSHNISVIDPTTDSVVARLDAGCQPLHAQYDPGSADVYVLCQSRDLDRIDSATGAIALAIDLGSCQQLSMTAGPGFAIDDATNRVFIADEDAYVPCTYGLNMTELALPSYSVGQALALGSLPAGVAATGPSGTTVVADRGAGRIDLVAPSGALLLRSRPVGLEPTYVAFDGRSNDVVISDSLLGNLTVLNASTLATVQSIALPTPAGVLSSDPADGAVLAALPVAGLVDRIVPGPNPVRASVPVGPDPTALADDSALATTLVYCSGDRSLWGVPDAGGGALRLATGLPNASGLGVDGATGEVVLSDASGGSLTVLNGTTFALLRTLGIPSNGSTPSRPGALGFDSADGALLVLDSAGNALGFVSPWRAPLTNETAVGGAPTAFAVEPDGTIVVADAASGTLTVASPLPVPTVDGIAVSPAPLLGSAGDRLSVHAQTSYGNATGIPGLEFRWNLAPASIGALNTSRGPADVGLVVGNTGFANGTLCATVSEGSLSVRGCVGLTVVPGPRYAATVTLAPGVLVIGTGQSVNFSAGVRTVDGAATIGPTLTWSVAPSALGSLTTGISGAAQFVAGAFPSQGTVCANASGGGGEAQACAAVTVGAIPRVTSVDPANRSMNVPLVSRVTVEFSTPMNATATESAFGVAPADPSGSVTVNGTSLVWTPSGNLKANVTYTITIGPGATSTVGVRLGHALTATFQTVPDLTSPKTASGPSWTVPLLALGAVAAIGVVAAVGWRRRRAKPSAPRGT